MIFIGPKQKENRRKSIVDSVKKMNIYLLLLLTLPFISWFVFQFNWISSAPQYSKELLAPVAKVQTPFGTGSAFLVGETRLITANHVVDTLEIGDEVTLIFEKALPVINTKVKVMFKPEGNNIETDFAVLELTNPGVIPEDFPRLILGNSEEVVIGDVITVIGYPASLFSVTEGKISNDKVDKFDLFQLDVGAWQGNSGGPIINKNTGEVIGILVAGLQGNFQGINVGCKIKNVMKILKQKGIDITK